MGRPGCTYVLWYIIIPLAVLQDPTSRPGSTRTTLSMVQQKAPSNLPCLPTSKPQPAYLPAGDIHTNSEKGSLIGDKYSRTGTGARRCVPLNHETFGRAGPTAFALLNEIAAFAASSGVVSKRMFLDNAMRDLSATLCRGITRQVLAKVPLRARMNDRAVVAGLSVPTDDLVPVAGGPSLLLLQPSSTPPHPPLTVNALPPEAEFKRMFKRMWDLQKSRILIH